MILEGKRNNKTVSFYSPWFSWPFSCRAFSCCCSFLASVVAKHGLHGEGQELSSPQMQVLGAGPALDCFSGLRLELSPLEKIQVAICVVLPVPLELRSFI